eukprot:scaffold14016_cov18-Tisochrysis_lutea.AAC.1
MGVPLKCVQRLPDIQDMLQVAGQGRGQHCCFTSIPWVCHQDTCNAHQQEKTCTKPLDKKVA